MRRSAVRRRLGVASPLEQSARSTARRLTGAMTRRVTRPEGAAPGGSSFTMPATAAFTIDALHFSHDESPTFGVATTAIDKFPAGLGAVTASGPDAGSVVYSLPETVSVNEQVAGWGINPSTGQLSLEFDQYMRDVCCGNTRTFKVRGSYGGVDHDTTVTITLDTSGYDLPIPGIDFLVGHGVLRPVTKSIAVDGIPPGWALWTGNANYNVWNRYLYPLADGAELKDWDLRGYQVSTRAPGGAKINLVIENNIFDRFLAQPVGANHPPLVDITTAGCTVRYNSFLMDGRVYPWNQNGLGFNSVGGVAEFNRFTQCQNDFCNGAAGDVENNYASIALTNTRGSDGVTWIPVPINHTGTANPANLAGNGTIIINGSTVNLTTGQTPAQVRDAIIAAALPNVTASIVTSPANALRITYTPGFDSLGDPLADLVLSGTLLTHFGMVAGTYVVTNHLNTWLHGDGIQQFGVFADSRVGENLIDCRFFGRDPTNGWLCNGRTAAIYFEGALSGSMTGNLIAENNYAFGSTYHLHAGGGTTPRTGTIALTSASTTVTGTSTTFLADFGLSAPGAPGTTDNNNKFVLRDGPGAGMEFTVTNVASNTSLTLSANAGVTTSGVKMWKGEKISGLTAYRNNRFAGIGHVGHYYPPRWQNQWEGNEYVKTATYTGTGAKTKGDAYGPTLNPTPVPPVFTIEAIGQSYAKFAWTIQTDTRTYFRHRTTSGPGAWSPWLLISDATRLYAPTGGDALAASTQYDFQAYTENWNTTIGAYNGVFAGQSGYVTGDASLTKLIADSANSSIVTGTTTSAGSLDAITSSYATACNTAGRALSTYEQDMFDIFVNTLQAGAADASNRDIFTRIDVMTFMALGSLAGKVNLVSPGTFDAVEVGSGSWTTTAPAGYRPNTNAAGDTSKFLYWAGYKGYHDAGNKADQNDTSLGVFVSQAGNVNNLRDLGGARSAFCLFNFNFDVIGRVNSTSDSTFTDALGPNGDFSGSETLRRGLHVGTRVDSANVTYSLLRPDGSAEISYTAAHASTATSTNSIFTIGGQNIDTTGANPTATTLSATNRHAMAFAGASLTAGERDVLCTATVTLLQNLSLY